MITALQLGGYGRYTLKASVLDDVRDHVGEFGSDYDLLALADAYRAQINAELEGTGVVLIGDDFYGAIGWLSEVAVRIDFDDEDEGCPIRAAIRRADLDTLIGSFEKGS